MTTEQIIKMLDDELVTPTPDNWRVVRAAKYKLQELEAKLSSIYRVAVGEDQVANDDTEGMAWIAEQIVPSPKASNAEVSHADDKPKTL